MTQEDKDILLKYLSMALPYEIKFAITNGKTETLKSIGVTKFGLIPVNLFYKKPLFYLINEFGNIEYKPYLRPMSSMTDEEIKEFTSIAENVLVAGKKYTAILGIDSINWLLEHHFDFMGLIPKDLAIEVTENNNPYK